MTQRTFGRLRAEALELLNRDDCTSTLMDQFLLDAITRIHRNLRIPSMENMVVQVAKANGRIDVPVTFLELIDFEDTALSEFVYLPPDEFRKLGRTKFTPQFQRRFYTRRGREFIFYPALDEGEELTVYCYTDPPEIVSDDDVIPLLIFAPEFVKYAALIFAAIYFEDDRQSNFATIYDAMRAEIDMQQEEMEMGNINASMYPEISDRY